MMCLHSGLERSEQKWRERRTEGRTGPLSAGREWSLLKEVIDEQPLGELTVDDQPFTRPSQPVHFVIRKAPSLLLLSLTGHLLVQKKMALE